MSNVSIILPISRLDHLDRVFAQLELMDCDRFTTSLLAFVDGGQELYEKARHLTVHSKFEQKLCVMRKKGSGSVGSVMRRRQRISDIHNEIKQYINSSDYVFLIEDDTIFPRNALTKLLEHYNTYPYAGVISTVELGRWGYCHIGAWEVNDVYSINEIKSPKLGSGIQKIDATGLYCCILKTKTYLEHEFKPFEKAMGPDFNLGIELRKAGYTNYVDYDLKCVHLTQKEPITFQNSEIVQVQLVRTEDEPFGWRTTTI